MEDSSRRSKVGYASPYAVTLPGQHGSSEAG
jgi:hypothetical protein